MQNAHIKNKIIRPKRKMVTFNQYRYYFVRLFDWDGILNCAAPDPDPG